MSDESDFDLDNEDDSPGIKKIRDAYKAIKKERDELRKIADEVQAERRGKSVAEALQSKGVDPDYASFYQGEDTSPEAVGAWVEKNAKLVNYAPQSPEDEARQQAAERITNVTGSAPPQSIGTVADLQNRLVSAKPAEIPAILAELENLKIPGRGL